MSTQTAVATDQAVAANAAGLTFPDLLVYRGYSAPSRIEASVYDLEIDGVLPSELSGSYFRACADPQYPPLLGTDIFINGDGMIHKIEINGGHADLITRYVRTDKFLAERAARRALFGAYRNPYTDDPSVVGVGHSVLNQSSGPQSVLRIEDYRAIQAGTD